MKRRLWIARDKDETLSLYATKPYKAPGCPFWTAHGYMYFSIGSTRFPEVKWEDKEPTEVELVIKKK